jgi:tricorn protease
LTSFNDGALALLILCSLGSSAAAAGQSAQQTAAPPAIGDGPVLMRFPNTSRDRIAFVAADQIWTAPRTGGRARELTTDPTRKMLPRFSPDGRWIAFTAVHGATADVEIIPADGGPARRLTYAALPGIVRGAPDNMVVTWTPDSRSIVFLARKASWNRWVERPFAAPLDGGMPSPLPVDRSGFLSFSPDGRSFAFNRVMRDFDPWKRYEGGQAQAVSIYDPGTRQIRTITDWKGTSAEPMWAGRKIYFVSDRDPTRRRNIWVKDLSSGATRQVTYFTDFDIDIPSLGAGAISFQEAGRLWRLDLPSETLHPLDIEIAGNHASVAPRTMDAASAIRTEDGYQYPWPLKFIDYAISPDGSRAAFSARGDIVVVPAGAGAPQNLTNSTDADEDHPAFSPDGRMIAYTTDSTAEKQIAVRPLAGGPERILTHFTTGFLYLPVWSPDGARLAFGDASHNLWLLDIRNGNLLQVARNPVREIRDPGFSPDGQWLAFSTQRPGGAASIHLFDIAHGRDIVVSDPLENDTKPVFSPDGRFLLFISSRRGTVLQSDSRQDFTTTFSAGLYAAVLRKDDTAPAAAGGSASTASATRLFRIDLDGLMRRVVPLPTKAANISDLVVRGTRMFYQADPVESLTGPSPGAGSSVHLLDLSKGEDTVLIDDLANFTVSGDGNRVLYATDAGEWHVCDVAPGHRENIVLPTGRLQVRVAPLQEWREIFENTWRLDRDLFVQADMGGRDWAGVRRTYEAFLPLLRSPSDATYLLQQLQGELGSSHMIVSQPDDGKTQSVAEARPIGADLALDASSGRYRLAHVYRGDNSRPDLQSPLTAPGVVAPEGSFLLAIDGTELKAPDDPDRLLAVTTGMLTLSLSATPDGPRHDVQIKPLRNELALRQSDWVAHNRETVGRISGGRLGYVYLPDMMAGGVMAMTQPTEDKEGLVVDVRYNRGGFITPWVLQKLRETPLGYFVNRQGGTEPRPATAMQGPTIVVANQYSVSDAEQFAYFFKQQGGQVVGLRTTGGVRGIASEWQLMDGGGITVPFNQIYSAAGQWPVEGHGVDPDVLVDDQPVAVLAGQDPQLDVATRMLMRMIGNRSSRMPRPPPTPDMRESDRASRQ